MCEHIEDHVFSNISGAWQTKKLDSKNGQALVTMTPRNPIGVAWAGRITPQAQLGTTDCGQAKPPP